MMISSMRGGGSERQTLLLLRHLDRSRFEPHLYLTERAGDLLSQVPDDVNIHSFDEAPPLGGLYFPGRALRYQIRHLRETLSREAIDVIYDRTFQMSIVAGTAAKKIRIPRVSTIVSPPEVALPLVESRFVSLKRKRLSLAYADAFAVVAVSRVAAESAAKYYSLDRNRIEVIHNPVDAIGVRNASSHLTVKNSKAVSLICVGRMTPEKGHLDLVSALIDSEARWPSSSPTITLKMIGDGPLRSQIEERWNATSCCHRIEFLGRQSNPAPWIAHADALVLPSHFEGMPNVVLEAMALGTPVIATRAGGTVELERDEATILWAEPNSPHSLADALIEFVNDRDGATERSAAASKLVAEHHDLTKSTDRIETLLERATRDFA